MTTPQWALQEISNAKRYGNKNINLSRPFETAEKISEIPQELLETPDLEWLNLRDNSIEDLSKTLSSLKKLRVLDLGNNKLHYIQSEISTLEKLEFLDLSNNLLGDLPSSMAQLKNLRWLNLSNNQFASFPNIITKLSSLTTLHLTKNKIEKLPENIWGLQNLKSLFVEGNKLTTLPTSIAEMSTLSDIRLGDNPLRTPPPEVAYKGIKAIIEYFRQLGGGQDFLYEAKLLIIGEGGAGKTTLARKLTNPSYKLQEEKSTEGIDVFQWSFPIDNNKNFRVNIWDFGGQEIYHTTHQFFLTKRSLYTLVADTRKEDTDFYYWMNTVELLSENSPLFIVKNEKQDRHREINERQLRGQFENLNGIFSTNLATNRGLEKLVEEIQQIIKKLPHIGSPLPKTWVRVRETLENDDRNYINVDAYLDICQRNGFTEIKDGLQLSGYLHDIGVFLHFQDDPILKKIVILKPKWGTDAVYKVLDNKDVIRNLGRFTEANLVNIWGDPAYNNMHDELLQLMMKFKLCYEIPGVKGAYTAPQLLTENQPNYPWDENTNLLLRYSYEFMPKGILTQFIVAMNQYIVSARDQSLVWKGGVVIAKDRTAAEVIEHYGKREIRIRVAGNHKKELLTIIMFQIDQIHQSYKRIKFHKLIPCNCEECRNSIEPHFYRYEQFQNFIEKRLENIQCGKSGAMVNVRSLIDDVISKEYQQNSNSINYAARVPQIQISVGDNSSIGNIMLDSTIQRSFNKVEESGISAELKDALKQLAQAVDTLSIGLSKELADEVTDDLSKLVDEAVKKSPNKKWYSVSIEGLIKAAENLGKVGEPVIELSRKVLSLLTPGTVN